MRFIKTEGIIIKRKNSGEADRVITVLTDRYGKIRLSAKGVRKPLAKYGSSLELFTLVTFAFILKKHKILTQVKPLRRYLFGKDMSKMALLFFMADILDSLAAEDQPNKTVFLFVKKFMKTLEESKSNKIPLLSYFFALNVLGLSGYQAEFFVCIHCFKKLLPGKKYFFNTRLGGVLCERCQHLKSLGTLSQETISALRVLSRPNFSLVSKLMLTAPIEKEVKIVTSQLLEEALEKDIQAGHFLKKVLTKK